jgi:hypothetical protein
MAEKHFFRIKVKETCPYSAVMVKNLGKVTKTWQLKKGDASDFAEYPNLDVQPMIKEGGTFVPASGSDSASGNESSGTGGSLSSSPAPAPQADKTAAEPEKAETNTVPGSYDFSEMSVEQLKAYLSAKGVSAGELRGLVKADLITRAEALSGSENV